MTDSIEWSGNLPSCHRQLSCGRVKDRTDCSKSGISALCLIKPRELWVMKGDHWPTVSHSLNAVTNHYTFITVCAVRLAEVEKPNTLFGKAGITTSTKC